jgi:hypothetical protein
MKKDFKSMALPFVGVVALAVGAFAGFNPEQVDSLKGAMEAVVNAVAVFVTLYGVYKSHDKN